MNNKWIKLTLMVLVMLTAYSCSSDDDDDEDDEWTRSVDFDGLPRGAAAGFMIGDNAYLTTGYGANSNRYVDTWRFDNSTTTWQRQEDFPGPARNGATSFSVNGIGYVGLGTNGTVMYKDFYAYNPTTNTWSQIADFPGTARYGSVAFVVNGVAYVGAGQDIDQQDYNDFYRYDPNSNTWTQISSTPMKRAFAFTFVINNVAYLGGGTNNGAYVSTFYAFDGNTWTEKNPLSGRTDDYTYDLRRINPAVFVIGGYGYIAGGTMSSTLSSTWRYDPNNDYWIEHDAFTIGGATARAQAYGFSVDGIGYVTTGRSGSQSFDDTWKFIPQL
ncbi:Kelch repeat-containing protein [Olivibacter sitiensis]|uniref:Kelch repeat-containing protein n=1 Tax=Olivibacter sitiensis TaxID=376470 RepID=UPI00042210AA|nr:kelch repeat-containing protein [Olivibacter sitiensis]